MINRPGLKCPVVDQHASMGQQTLPPTMHLQDAVSPLLSLGQFLVLHCFLLFRPIYFHFFPRATLPLVSVEGSRVPVLVPRVQAGREFEPDLDE